MARVITSLLQTELEFNYWQRCNTLGKLFHLHHLDVNGKEGLSLECR